MGAITRPLGFYALALLIVESFLIIVLTKGNLDAQLQAEGMRSGVRLVVGVISIVTFFVWFRPDNLILSGKEKLEDKRISARGDQRGEVTSEELLKGEQPEKEEE